MFVEAEVASVGVRMVTRVVAVVEGGAGDDSSEWWRSTLGKDMG